MPPSCGSIDYLQPQFDLRFPTKTIRFLRGLMKPSSSFDPQYHCLINSPNDRQFSPNLAATGQHVDASSWPVMPRLDGDHWVMRRGCRLKLAQSNY